jgi:hypothetical protein
MARNFTCPKTEQPCEDGGCTRTSCVLMARERQAEQTEAARKLAAHGWWNRKTRRWESPPTLDDLLRL